MESSSNNTGEEDLRFNQSLPGPTLKPGEAFIQIDSISIDLPSVNSKNDKNQKCEHFSIRKYVSDMRQKDNKACWLFESDRKSGSAGLEPKYPHPPLDVPKFRWWQCRNCLQGICEKENGKLVLLKNLNGDCNSDSPSCTHIALTGSETTVLVSEFKQILKLENSAEKGEAAADLSVGVTANESRALLCSDQKGERDGGSNGTMKVPENGLEDNSHLELPRPSRDAAEVNDSHREDVEAVDAAGLQSASANCEVNGVLSSPKNLQLQRDASVGCDRETKAVRSAQNSPVAVDGANHEPDTLILRQKGHPSDELDYPSSDSAEVGPGYKSRDKPGALRRRKVRKVRLLSDLLGVNENLNGKSIVREEIPLPTTSDATEELGAKKVFPGRKMKRKFCQEDEPKAIVLYDEVSEVKTVKEGAEEGRKADLETVKDDTFAVMSPTSILKNGWTPHGEDETAGLVMKKRKIKKNTVEPLQHVVTEADVVPETENRAYSLMSPVNTLKCDLTKHIDDGGLRIITKKKKTKNNELGRESIPEKLGESRGKVAFDFSHTSNGHDPLTSREMGCSSSPVLKADRTSCMCKKKSKMTQGDDDYIAQIPPSSSSKLREDSVSGIKFGLVQSGPTSDRFLPSDDGMLKKGTDISSYSGKTEAKYAFSLDYGPVSTMPWQQLGSDDSQIHKKNRVSTHLEPNVPSRSRPDGFFKNRVHHNHKSKEPSYRMPFPNEKQHYASRFEDMGHFLVPQKAIPSTTSKGENTGSQEQPTPTKNHINKTSNGPSARGTSDDIPMEIVELMAKLQYESSLHDTVKDWSRSDARKLPSYQNLSFGREYKRGDLNLLQKESSTGGQIPPKNVKKVQNAKQKAVDINYPPQVNMSYPITTQVEQNQNQNPFKGHHGVLFSQYHEKPSGSKRNEDAMGNNYKVSGAVGGLSACNTYHVGGRSEEPFRFWSSSSIPIARDPAQENVSRNGVVAQFSDLKSPGLKARNKYEDPNKAFLKKSSMRENSYAPRPNGVKVQSPLGSSEFYSNEKISALHLLSLMDDHSTKNVNGKPRFVKQSSSVARGRPQELDFGAYKASETLRHPSADYRTIDFMASGKCDQKSPAIPILGSSSSLFDTREDLRNGVMGQVPLKVREKGKKKCSDLVGSIGGLSSHKYVTSGYIPVLSQQMNGVIRAPNALLFPPKFHTVDKSEKEHLRIATGSVQPPVYGIETGICTINRNPAEFSVPEAGNVYTIRGSELKLGKRVLAPEWSAASVIDLDRPKRGRKKKIATNHQVEN